tara:strand:+ start:739 stop:1065 length:327 start_codon:yes stop_codon:yes gene_type:complete
MKNKIEKAVTRLEVSYRGGGVEIDLKPFGFKEGSKMSAYQNYLGGGMLGAIQSNHNLFRTSFTSEETKKLEKISLELKQFFHDQTNHEGDEWEEATFEENQKRPSSAY